MTKKPNILLLVTDQQRGDCLGVDGHPVLQTPYLDQIASRGIRFRRGYSACPVCVAARRTLMTGQKASSHGVFMNHHLPLSGPTLPGELAKAGYQTHLVGKLHLSPPRKLYGFCSSDWADSPRPHPVFDDYERFLIQSGLNQPRSGLAHGTSQNGYTARPFHLEERFHFTNWCADRAINFLERRDPTVPFFLKVSFHQPHQPLTPPAVYFNRYMQMNLPKPVVGSWAKIFDQPQKGLPVNSWRVCLDDTVQKQMQAGYYGCINHIDDQVGRILEILPKETVIIFVSDHGEMLGDHQWIRKRNAFESSARVPFFMQFPQSFKLPQEQVLNHPVELMDIMPTCLDLAGVKTPQSVDGVSLLTIIQNTSASWRDYVHGECAQVPTLNSGQQYLTDGQTKYIWYPGTGEEHYFDLINDPNETINLATESCHQGEIRRWRTILAKQLYNRPEGFTNGQKLRVLGQPTPNCLPYLR